MSQGSSLEEGRGGLAGTGGRRQGDSNVETVCGGVGVPQNLRKGSGLFPEPLGRASSDHTSALALCGSPGTSASRTVGECLSVVFSQ